MPLVDHNNCSTLYAHGQLTYLVTGLIKSYVHHRDEGLRARQLTGLVLRHGFSYPSRLK